MTLLDAITTLLDATHEMTDRPHIRRARKVLENKAERLRFRRERCAKAAAEATHCRTCDGRGWLWAPASDSVEPVVVACQACSKARTRSSTPT
jgi:hypothetical protein